jgi:hypothetical protein
MTFCSRSLGATSRSACNRSGISDMPPKHIALGASLLTIAFVTASEAEAQQNLPTMDVGGQKLRSGRAARRGPAPSTKGRSAPAEAGATIGAASGRSGGASQPALFTPGGGSLVAPAIPVVREELKRNVGSVAFVDANTPEQQTRYIADLRDALKEIPGVYAESRYGQELRLSIRGSNLSSTAVARRRWAGSPSSRFPAAPRRPITGSCQNSASCISRCRTSRSSPTGPCRATFLISST